jgi:hypothetical protein
VSADGFPDAQVNALAASAGRNGRSPSAGPRGSREGPPEALIRDRAVIARVTLDEKERVHEDARQAGKETISDYIRGKLGLVERDSGPADAEDQ